MINCIPLFHADVTTYPCPNPGASLADFCQQKGSEYNFLQFQTVMSLLHFIVKIHKAVNLFCPDVTRFLPDNYPGATFASMA